MEKNYNQVIAGEPNIETLEELEEILGYSSSELDYLAIQADGYYSKQPTKDRIRPFAKKPISKKKRWVNPALGPLEVIQDRIQKSILTQVRLPDYICGGVKGKSTYKNALMHQKSSVLIKIDIQDYFGSITRDRVYQVWNQTLGCSPTASDILTGLTTYKGCLPQGAHTSTSLANIFLYSIDKPIRAECDSWGISYSAWVDDLAFSGKEARRIIPVAIGTLKKAGLRISRKKFRLLGPGERQLITGLNRGSMPSVPREYVNRVRAGVHKLRTGQIQPDQLKSYLEGLEGSIAYIIGVNPERGEKLKRDLDYAKELVLQKN